MGEKELGLEAEVKGTTLRVYWHLFKLARPVGPREIQRGLKFSSPSTALYHLEKLRRLGVVRKDELGRYYVDEGIKIGAMRFFLRFGSVLLPRYLFYTIFFAVALTAYIIQSLVTLMPINIMAVIFGAVATLTYAYELQLILREKHF